MEEDCAGSMPKRESTIGTSAPAMPAITMAITMALEITITRPVEPLQK